MLFPGDLERITAQGRIHDDVGVTEGDKMESAMMMSLLIGTANRVKYAAEAAVAKAVEFNKLSPTRSVHDLCIGVEVTDAHLRKTMPLLDLQGNARTASWGV
ncbi:MAG: hypothetical protein FWD69_03415 [Polyangiaceae bacterium]|nr:hypothetical protein [Polyangiaceae bacterium]